MGGLLGGEYENPDRVLTGQVAHRNATFLCSWDESLVGQQTAEQVVDNNNLLLCFALMVFCTCAHEVIWCLGDEPSIVHEMIVEVTSLLSGGGGFGGGSNINYGLPSTCPEGVRTIVI